nr:hypothetical protein [Planctomycetota bacterium]
MRTALLMCFLVIGAASAVEHRAPEAYFGDADPQPAQPLPAGLNTVLEAPTGRIFLGQSWLVHYVVRNRGTQEFSIELGGDGRAVRPTRTWLEAVAPDGTLGADPLRDRPVMSMGGMGGTFAVPPDGEQIESMMPQLFVEIDRPGRWIVRAFHDLGLGPMQGDDDPRWASIAVELAMPDAEQAAAVLAAHEALLVAADHGRSMGERSQTPANFAAMSQPIYLPLL